MKQHLPNVEIVSLHIPKTAGTSFKTVLQKQYGVKKVARFDIYNSDEIHVDEKYMKGEPVSNKFRALHGHFNYVDFHKSFTVEKDVPFVTWLRDPVARVMSEYNYFKKIIGERMNEAPEEGLMRRMGRSIEEFVVLEENRNVMSKFLKGADLSKFRFVGVQDFFAQDLDRLSKVMDWTGVTNNPRNITGGKKQDNEELKSYIKSLNTEDYKLYDSVLKMNGQAGINPKR